MDHGTSDLPRYRFWIHNQRFRNLPTPGFRIVHHHDHHHQQHQQQQQQQQQQPTTTNHNQPTNQPMREVVFHITKHGEIEI